MARHGRIKGPRALLLTLLIAAVIVGVIAALRGQYARFLAEHWRRQLDSIPDDRADALLEQVAQLGEAGVPVLVDALGSQRESVARGGKRALLDQIRQWEMLPARDSSRRLAILARALADRVDQLGPRAQTEAADLVTRILLWPLDETAVDSGRVIAACETVLRATSPQRRQAAETRLPDRSGPFPPGGQRREAGPAKLHRGEEFPKDRPPATGTPLPDLAKLPAGRLPIGIPPASQPPLGASDASRMAELRSVEPRPRLTDPLLRQPPGLLTEPHQSRATPSLPAPAYRDKFSRPSPMQPTPSPRQMSSSAGRPFGGGLSSPTDGSAAGNSASSRWAGVDTVELMRQLHAADASLAANARAELQRGGFSQVHLELAWQLFHPDPQVRKQLARRLLELRSVDAVPWLLQLSRDDDPEVRRMAITLMATTGDPTLLSKLEQIAREDPDPGVQRQAESIAEQRQRMGY